LNHNSPVFWVLYAIAPLPLQSGHDGFARGYSPVKSIIWLVGYAPYCKGCIGPYAIVWQVRFSLPSALGIRSGSLFIPKRMKIFLQHKETSFYLTRNAEWTGLSREAIDFFNYDLAVDFAAKHGLTEVQVVLKFPDQPYHICLPFQRNAPPSSIQI
jgi:hypothetical protein